MIHTRSELVTKRIDLIWRHSADVENRYDAENDLIPGAPAVTWADRKLLDMVLDLTQIVEDLQAQINGLRLESLDR